MNLRTATRAYSRVLCEGMLALVIVIYNSQTLVWKEKKRLRIRGEQMGKPCSLLGQRKMH